ncbi:hypothetical protein WIS52_11855 [Pseudonocardia nematodicida]|uniref:Uncharacterized protein n=1 Tax=Pseudonocardia nematodicida TaxID=1206997 RepID=A0ABV1KAI7_9PSEU
MSLCLLQVGTVRPSTWAALVRRGLADKVSGNGPALYDFTAEGQRVAEALAAEVQETPTEDGPAESKDQETEADPAYDGPVIRDAVVHGSRSGVVREVSGRSGVLGSLVEFGDAAAWFPHTAMTRTEDGSWTVECTAGQWCGAKCPGCWIEPDTGDRQSPTPIVPEPRSPAELRRADEIHAGECQPPEAEHEPSRTTLTRADEVRSGDVLIHAGKRRTVLGTWTERGDVVISTLHGTLTMPPSTPLRTDPAQLALSLAG